MANTKDQGNGIALMDVDPCLKGALIQGVFLSYHLPTKTLPPQIGIIIFAEGSENKQ